MASGDGRDDAVAGGFCAIPASGGDPAQPVDVSRMDAQMSTLLGMAQSRAVCARAVNELGLGMSLAALQRNVQVEQVLDTQAHPPTTLIRLQVQANSPGMSVVMANAVAESFRDFYKDVSHREAVDNRRFLDDQVRVARGKMDEAEERLREYTIKKNITILLSQVQASLDGLKGLRTDLDAALARRMEVSARLAVQSRQVLAMRQTRRLTELTSDGSSAAQLRTQITSMEQELSMLRNRYTARHPGRESRHPTRAGPPGTRPDLRQHGRQGNRARNPAYDATSMRTVSSKRSALLLCPGSGPSAALSARGKGRLRATWCAMSDLGRRTEYKNAQDNYNAILARLNQAGSRKPHDGYRRDPDHRPGRQPRGRYEARQTQLLIAALVLEAGRLAWGSRCWRRSMTRYTQRKTPPGWSTCP